MSLLHRHSWYNDNERYKAAFPAFQKTTLVVVSSPSAKAAFLTGEKIADALRTSNHFKDVFAPQYSAFFKAHVLYQAPVEGVKRIAERVSKNLPEIQNLYHAPNLTQAFTFYKKQLDEDRTRGFLSDTSRYFLSSFNRSVDAAHANKTVPLAFIQPLLPRDTEETHYQFIVINSEQALDQKLPNKLIIDNIHEAVAQIAIPEGVKVRVTGETALANDEITAAMSGVELSGIISLVLLLLILFVGIRYKRLIAGIFLMLLIGITWTVALGTWVVGAFNTLSLIFLVMFFGLAVDFAVHFSLTWLEKKESGLSRGVATVKTLGGALFLCALTSSLAFLSFVPTDYRGLAELGKISALGMLIALILSVIFLPAWLAVFKRADALKPLYLNAFHPDINKKNAYLILVASAIFILLGSGYATKVTFDYSVLAMQDENTEAMTTLVELQDNNQLNDYGIAVMLTNNDDKAIIIEKLKALPLVSRVSVPSDIIPKFQAIKQQYMLPVHQSLAALKPSTLLNEGDSSAAIIDFANALTQLKPEFFDEDQALLDETITSVLSLKSHAAFISMLNEAATQGINHDMQTLKSWFAAKPFSLLALPSSLKERLIDPKGEILIQVLPAADLKDRQMMTAFIEQVAEVAPNIAGRSVVEWGVGSTVKGAFVEATLIAIGVIFFVLLLYFKSLVWPLVVFVPIGMTAVFAFCLVRFTGLTLNMANILVIPLIFGLGVDTGLHVLHRYRHEGSLDALAFSGTHRAVLISALTTIGTFFSLSFSTHKGAASIGILLSASILFLLLATFVVLPAILKVLPSQKNSSNKV